MTGKNLGGVKKEAPVLKTAEQKAQARIQAAENVEQAKSRAAEIKLPADREAQALAEQQRRDAKIQQGSIPYMAGVDFKIVDGKRVKTILPSAKSYIEANVGANQQFQDDFRKTDSFYPNQSIGTPPEVDPRTRGALILSEQQRTFDPANPSLYAVQSPARLPAREAIDTWFDTPNTKPESYQLYAGDSPSTRSELAQRLLLESMTGRVQKGGGAFFTPVKGVALDENQLAEVRRQISEITGNPDRVFALKSGEVGIRKHPWSDPRNMYLPEARQGVALNPPFKRGEDPTPGVVRQVAPVYGEDIWKIGTAGFPGVGSSFPTPNPDGRGMTFRVPRSATPSPDPEGYSLGFPNYAGEDLSIEDAIAQPPPKPVKLDTRATRAFEAAGPGAKIILRGFDGEKQALAEQGLSILQNQGYGGPQKLSQQLIGFTDLNGRLKSKFPINNITATTDIGGMTPGSTVFIGQLWGNPAGASTENLRDREARRTYRVGQLAKNGVQLVDGKLPPGTQAINFQNGQSVDVWPTDFTDMGVRNNTKGWTSERQLLSAIGEDPGSNGALIVDGMPGGKGQTHEYYDEYGGIIPGKSGDYDDDNYGTADLDGIVGGDNTQYLKDQYDKYANAQNSADLAEAYWDSGTRTDGRAKQVLDDLRQKGGYYVDDNVHGGKKFVPLSEQDFQNYQKLIESGSDAAYSRLVRDPESGEVVSVPSDSLNPNSSRSLMGSSGLRQLEDESNRATAILAQQARELWRRPTPETKPVMTSSDVEGVESKRDRPAQSRFAGTAGYIAPEMRNLNSTGGEGRLFELLNKTFTGQDPYAMTRPISETQPLGVGRMGTLVEDRRKDVAEPRVAGQRANTLEGLRESDPELFDLFNQPGVRGFNVTNVQPNGEEIAPPQFPEDLKHGVYLGGPTDPNTGEFLELPGKDPYDRAKDYYGLISTVPATDKQAGGISDGGYIDNLGTPQQVNRTQVRLNPLTGEEVKVDRTDITGKTYIEGVVDLEKIAERNQRMLRAVAEDEFRRGKIYRDEYDRPMAPHQDFLDTDGVPLHQKFLDEDRAMGRNPRPTLYDFSKQVHEYSQPGRRKYNMYQDEPVIGEVNEAFRALPENLLLQAYATKEMNNRAKQARRIANAYATGTYNDPGDTQMAFSVLTENGPQTVLRTLSPEKYVEIADAIRASGPPLIQTKPRLSWEITDRLEAVHDMLTSGRISKAEYDTQVHILTNGLVQDPQATVDFRQPIAEAVEVLPSPERVGQAFPGVDRSRQVPTGGPMMRIADDYTTQYVGETADAGRTSGPSVTQYPDWKNYLFEDQFKPQRPRVQVSDENNLYTPKEDQPSSFSARKGRIPRTAEEAAADRALAEEADRKAAARLKALEDAEARRKQAEQVARWQK